jgi:xylulokinase
MFLGIDLGTSEIKFLLLDGRNQITATIGEALTALQPQPLWSEQNPSDWWAATERGLSRLAVTHPKEMACVRAIGLSGQMHGAVLLDANNAVLRPAILWNDGRSGAHCAALEASVPGLHAIAGNLAMPGFTAPKLLWVREHEPDLFSRTASVLLPKDWLRLQLSGAAVSDFSDASGTLWLDVGKRCWSDELLAATGLTTRNIPRLVEGSEPSGHLLPQHARRWGLPSDVVIAGGAGDNAASAVGMGLVEAGQGFVSLGTSGVIFMTTVHFLPNPAQAMHAFCHALPGRWHQMSVMLSAASAVSWAARNFGFSDEAALLEAASALPVESRTQAPFFLPYLSGERTPHNNPNATAQLGGLTSAHGRNDIAYAIVEGVSFGLLDGFNTLSLPGSRSALTLSVVGGGSRSASWVQMLADVLGISLTTHDASAAGAALGAARLGWLAAGGSEQEVCAVPAVARRFVPRAQEHEALHKRYQRFRALYATLSC